MMPAPKLYNWTTKQWDIVPDDKVTEGVANGDYSFEHGIQVPAVGPDGDLVNIPSQNVREAFQNGGYRWQTADDQKAWEQSQNEAIDEAHFGDGGDDSSGIFGHAADAALAHVAMGGLPGSGFIAHGMANAMGKDPAEFDHAYQQLTERNPKASFAGDLGGALLNPVVGAVGKAGQAVGEAGMLGADLASGLGESGVLASRAGRIVDDFAPQIVRGMAEGGYFAAHDTLNEAALGDPGEAAEHLLSNVGMGLIFGGVGGAAAEGFSKGASPIKNILSDKLDALGLFAQKAAQKSAKGAILPTLPAEARGAASELIGNQELRNIVFGAKDSEEAQDVIKSLSSDISSTTAEAQAAAKQHMSDFRYSIKNEPRAVQNEINAALNSAGSEFNEATNEMYSGFQGEKALLSGQLAQDGRPGTFFQPMVHDVEKLIDALRGDGNAVAKQKANELSTYLEAQKAGIARDLNVPVDHPDLHLGVSAGQEQRLAQRFREIAQSTKSSLPADLQARLDTFHDGLTSIMHGQEEFGGAVKKLDDKYTAYTKLRDFLDEKTGGLKGDIVRRLQVDPEYAHELDTIMTHFPDTAPILQNFKRAIEDPLQMQVHLNTLKQAIREGGAETYGRMGVEDYSKLADMIGSADLQAKAETLRRVQAASQTSGPISKLAANLQALGRPVPEIFKKLEPHQDGLEKLAGLLGGIEPTVIERMLTKMTRGAVKGSLFSVLAPVIGSAVGHTMFHGPLGYVAGGVASVAARRLFNPIANIEALTRLQNGIQKGFKLINKATDGAVNALTQPELRTIAAAAGPALPSDKKKTYQSRMDYLTKLKDPDTMATHLEARLGSNDAAPNITAAIHGQYAKTVDFLTGKMPQDPLMHQGLMGHDSPYVPSDMEMAKFERYHQAAVDPVSALKNIAAMRSTPQEIETLRTLYPNTFQRLQEGVVDAIMKPDIKLSFQQRVQIGQMFGIPTEASMRPDFVKAMQANFNNQAGQGPQSSGVKANPKVAFDPQSQSTETERITFQ